MSRCWRTWKCTSAHRLSGHQKRLKRWRVVNICGLFRRPAKAIANRLQPALPWQEMLRGEKGSLRHQRLAEAVLDESAPFAKPSRGCRLGIRRAGESGECRVGDTITMIPPVTGNGMSMAFESAEIAIGPLADYSAGKLSWSVAQQTIAQRCDDTFAQRLAWADGLQRLMLLPRLQNALVLFAPKCQRVWRLLLAKTR